MGYSLFIPWEDLLDPWQVLLVNWPLASCQSGPWANGAEYLWDRPTTCQSNETCNIAPSDRQTLTDDSMSCDGVASIRLWTSVSGFAIRILKPYFCRTFHICCSHLVFENASTALLFAKLAHCSVPSTSQKHHQGFWVKPEGSTSHRLELASC